LFDSEKRETLTVLKHKSKIPDTELCSFCISKGTCKKPEADRENDCKDYMLKIECEKERNE
jgi:hypothetical protein